MTSRRKSTLLGLGVAFVLFALPVVWSAFSSHAYFYDGRCACGHDIFVRIVGDGYFSYSPGHGMPENLRFKIRKISDGWEVLGPPHSEDSWPSLGGEGGIIGHLRLRGGGLEDTFHAGGEWRRHSRVYNIWRVWAAKLRERWPDLG